MPPTGLLRVRQNDVTTNGAVRERTTSDHITLQRRRIRGWQYLRHELLKNKICALIQAWGMDTVRKGK